MRSLFSQRRGALVLDLGLFSFSELVIDHGAVEMQACKVRSGSVFRSFIESLVETCDSVGQHVKKSVQYSGVIPQSVLLSNNHRVARRLRPNMGPLEKEIFRLWRKMGPREKEHWNKFTL